VVSMASQRCCWAGGGLRGGAYQELWRTRNCPAGNPPRHCAEHSLGGHHHDQRVSGVEFRRAARSGAARFVGGHRVALAALVMVMAYLPPLFPGRRNARPICPNRVVDVSVAAEKAKPRRQLAGHRRACGVWSGPRPDFTGAVLLVRSRSWIEPQMRCAPRSRGGNGAE